MLLPNDATVITLCSRTFLLDLFFLAAPQVPTIVLRFVAWKLEESAKPKYHFLWKTLEILKLRIWPLVFFCSPPPQSRNRKPKHVQCACIGFRGLPFFIGKTAPKALPSMCCFIHCVFLPWLFYQKSTLT